jgi:hypothetical protein
MGAVIANCRICESPSAPSPYCGLASARPKIVVVAKIKSQGGRMRGDSFRDRIAQVLRARYGQALTEHKVGGKDADIFFSMRYPGGAPIKIAVEAKDWQSPLQSHEITRIYSQYLPAFEAKDIDSLWIVAKHPFRAEQFETAQSFGMKLRLFTIESLYNEIIDFAPYLNFLVTEFDKGNFSSYYILPRSNDGLSLHDQVVLPWLKGSQSGPLAVIAGYGAGKTSYARYLARCLALVALDDATEPKPIYLQLGSLTKQQSIRSLINSLFSDEFSVDGYKYPLFNILLEQGHFVVILDGFDEMKHAMRTRDILSNFDNIRQFMKNTKSKFLVLGRPTPFLSVDDEAAFSPHITIGDQKLEDVTQIPFTMVGLDEFSDAEVERFLIGYLTQTIVEKTTESITDQQVTWVKNRVNEIKEKNIRESFAGRCMQRCWPRWRLRRHGKLLHLQSMICTSISSMNS